MEEQTHRTAKGGDAGFQNQDQSSIKFNPDSKDLFIRNVSYSERFLNRANSLDYYFVKQIEEARTNRGAEGADSRITTEIYGSSDSQPLRSIVHRAYRVDVLTNFIQVLNHSGIESQSELSEIWQDNTFLTYNDKYYHIDIPNARIDFFLGYLSDARNDSLLVHGELRFAHSFGRLAPGTHSYTNAYKAISRVQFKARSKALFDRVVPFNPTITLLKHTEKDEIVEQQDYQELRLWSYNHSSGLNGISFVAMKLEFQNDTTITKYVPILNGFLFGDSSAVRIEYLDERPLTR